MRTKTDLIWKSNFIQCAIYIETRFFPLIWPIIKLLINDSMKLVLQAYKLILIKKGKENVFLAFLTIPCLLFLKPGFTWLFQQARINNALQISKHGSYPSAASRNKFKNSAGRLPIKTRWWSENPNTQQKSPKFARLCESRFRIRPHLL